MLVSYKDASTGAYTPAQPVVWERPAGFSKELATKLRDYENLAAHVFKVTRIGAGKDTKYSLDYIPLYDKPETVPADFSAFNNFDITKHSFWVKTAEDLEGYLATGSFQQQEPKPAEEKAVEEALGFVPETAPVVTPVVEAPKEEPKPAETPKFKGFSF